MWVIIFLKTRWMTGLDVNLRVVAINPCGWPCSLFHDSSDGPVHCLDVDTQLGES